jgi:hypothetical protein
MPWRVPTPFKLLRRHDFREVITRAEQLCPNPKVPNVLRPACDLAPSA